MSNPDDGTLTLTLTERQARCISDALDFYSRIGIGQVEELAHKARLGFLRGRDGRLPGTDRVAEIENGCSAIKAALGLERGQALGISHPAASEDARRAHEIKKQIDQFLAMRRNPNPAFRGVDYDGRMPHYTQDPDVLVAEAPKARPGDGGEACGEAPGGGTKRGVGW